MLAALYKGVADEAARCRRTRRITVLTEALKTRGWLLPPPNIGDYGTDYAFRALIAVVGLGANTPDRGDLPVRRSPTAAASLFNGVNDYRLTFAPGRQPPAKYFWSLTMYDSDGYLVPNPIDRYSIGPSHPPLLRQPDGSIVIAIQQTEPAEANVNWLPSPSGGFRLNLRLYGSEQGGPQWRSGARPGVVKVG